MKVRKKGAFRAVGTPYEYEYVNRCGPYYICKDCNIGPLVALPVEQYEEVPTETWRDVTAEMIIGEDGESIRHPRWAENAWIPVGYRLRKVQLFGGWYDWGGTGRKPVEGSERLAFIIEKRHVE